MRRSYHERVADGKRLAELNRLPMHVFAIQRDPNGNGKILRVLDYGEMTAQKARCLVRKLDSTFISATYMNPECAEHAMNCEKGYKTWGVPIVNVDASNINPVTRLPVPPAI